MEQVRALNALEPFLVLSKSATNPRAAADLITQATSSPNTFLFAELLHTPTIQALRKSQEHSQYLTLLEIFSWGTIADYNSQFTPTS
jgi:COP9 signalosome complex subunit 7